MELQTALPRPRNTVATDKGNLLPSKTQLTIPAGLDWVIKRQLNQVIQQRLMGVCCTEYPLDDLYRLDQTLGQTEQKASYTLTIYGYELITLCGFLMEQEQWYSVWWPNVVPAELQRQTRASLKGFLETLRPLCRTVDVFASRPVGGRN